MELRVLRYFLEVAREGNITRAAQSLYISQPTLSRQLKELEEELGKRLFVRSNHSVKLTKEGMLLRRRAEDILEMVDKTTEEFKSLDTVSAGDIRIGCTPSGGLGQVLPVIEKLHNRFPNIRYHFYSSSSKAVSEGVDRGFLDFALIGRKGNPARYQCLRVPFHDRWGVVMRKDAPLAQKETVSPKDLQQLPLICSRQALEAEIPRWLGESGDRLQVVATYDLLFNTQQMVREKFGYIVEPEGAVDGSLEEGLCFRPLEPELLSPSYVIWKKYQVFSPVATLLLQDLKSAFGTKAH